MIPAEAEVVSLKDPGEDWTANRGNNAVRQIIGRNDAGEYVWDCTGPMVPVYRAGPDLLAALLEAVKLLPGYAEGDDAGRPQNKLARDAIAKAEGGGA